jgi:hypothetical protein
MGCGASLKMGCGTSKRSPEPPPAATKKEMSPPPEYEKNVLALRNKVRNNEVLDFEKPIIFVLYGPPDSPTERSAEYLASKAGLPILYPCEYMHRTINGQIETIKQSYSKIPNVSSRQLRKMSSSVVADATRLSLSDLFYNNNKYKKGWIMYEYPDTSTEMKYFRKTLFKDVQIVLFFFDIDSEV